MSRSSAEQAKARKDCFHAHKRLDAEGRVYLECCFCDAKIDPATEAWEAAHLVRHTLTRDNSPENVKPAHFKCHRATVPKDITENAKGKRVSDKHFGIKKKSGFRGSRKFNGEVTWKR